jgi:hypothetical protein
MKIRGRLRVGAALQWARSLPRGPGQTPARDFARPPFLRPDPAQQIKTESPIIIGDHAAHWHHVGSAAAAAPLPE